MGQNMAHVTQDNVIHSYSVLIIIGPNITWLVELRSTITARESIQK